VAQIVRNLVDNALKFTPAGGRVELALTEQDEAWSLTVKDSGRGIEPDPLGNVFDEFWQGGRREGSGGRGLGLGLAIVKHLVELHGGAVHVSSPGPDQGATFRVELPRLREEPQAAPGKPLEGLDVLVVEDDAATLEGVALALERAGASAQRARSAAEALRALAVSPDVLVSDIGLPDGDGLALIRALREGPEPLRSLPALAVTGRAGVGERAKILGAGFDAYLAKPVEPGAVIACIVALRARARGTL
jgi:CheY-like chemotaxis protein